MAYRDDRYQLIVQYDARGCELSEARKAAFDRDLERVLFPLIEDFPRTELHVAVEQRGAFS